MTINVRNIKFLCIYVHMHMYAYGRMHMVPHYLQVDLQRIHIGSIYYYMYFALD